jgi:ADP-heptose:LPS heptosyltransferase
MNADTARKVDYYVGVPLCLAGTLVRKICSLFSRHTRVASPKNVVFIELSEMGSALLADPAMRKLKRSGGVNLFFAIFERNSPSLELLDTVPRGNIFRMRDSGVLAVAADAFRFWSWVRKNRIDTVIDLELFSRFTALLTGFSGADRTVGFHAFYSEGLYRGDFLTHKVTYNPHVHIAKNFIALVNALLSSRKETPFSKTVIPDDEIVLHKAIVSDSARAVMRDKVRALYPAFDAQAHHIVLFNTDASDLIPFRRWPQEHYVNLAKMVLEHYPRVIILLTGERAEQAGKDIMVKSIGSSRCLNFAGRTAIAELPALYSISTVMLSNDSGPAQFASVTDMRTFVLFGPETPRLYGPLGKMTPIYAGLACSPCVTAANHRKTVCDDNVCLQVITPERVLQIIKPSLDGSF